jgi:hypothetical protein
VAKEILVYLHSGFSVDTSERIEAHDRAGLVVPLCYAKNFNLSEEKLAAAWTYATIPLFSAAERAALAAASQPNAMTDELFTATRVHWSEAQIVEILGVVAMFGFLNRWNDTMATPLEAAPNAVAAKAVGAQWSAGKHAF